MLIQIHLTTDQSADLRQKVHYARNHHLYVSLSIEISFHVSSSFCQISCIKLTLLTRFESARPELQLMYPYIEQVFLAELESFRQLALLRGRPTLGFICLERKVHAPMTARSSSPFPHFRIISIRDRWQLRQPMQWW